MPCANRGSRYPTPRPHRLDELCVERFYFVGTTVRCFMLPDVETNAVKVNSSPLSSLMITEDLPLISTSSEEVQLALVNVGSTIFPILFKDALKASAILGLKIESKSS